VHFNSSLKSIKKKWSDVYLINALRWVILGACMKRFVADNIGEITVKMNAPFYHELGSFDRLLLLFMYSFQIYADFFGYSAIAIGIALIFGYRLPINFDRPYSAASFSEFWRCWHISLSTWLRNYLYIPLGGNRLGSIRTYVNLMIVMLLGGLWHGAGINYLLWGGAHGLFLASERLVIQSLGGRYSAQLIRYEFVLKLLKLLRVLIVFSSVSCVWVLFKLTNFSDVVAYMAGISPTNTMRTLPLSLYLTCLMLATPVFLQHWGGGY
jgi:alginate O-acetyltransferase complex protein AlgI